MLSPKHTLCALAALLSLSALASRAEAGLYGFSSANPYTEEEKVLRMPYLPMTIRNYRADMRENLQMLIDYAKKNNPNFQVITHEGQELLHKSSWEVARDGYNLARQKQGSVEDKTFLIEDNQAHEPKLDTPEYKYLNSVDAVAINGLFCGNGLQNNVTFNHNLGLISLEYCPSHDEADRAIVKSFLENKILYVFEDKNLAFKSIAAQPLINDSAKNIDKVSDAKNILILDDDSLYSSKDELVRDLSKTNFDIIVIKPLFANHHRFSADDIRLLQFKKNGAKRLLIAEMNVSEANPEDYFWDPRWQIGKPEWLVRQSFVNKDSVIAEYWNENWRKLIAKHFRDILNSGFDGVFFTGIQNHFYFEQQTPLE